MNSFLSKAGLLAAAALVASILSAPQASADTLAKNLFGAAQLPAATAPKSFGFYSKGCFSGGMAIATDGPTWQAMRLSRNRRWGHPTMIRLIEKLSHDAVADGWPGLLLGDISQPRGGPMLTGHASHQIGLDADIWLTPMPDRRLSAAERENMSATSMIRKGGLTVDERLWTPAHMRLLKRAASYPEVERILVHPGIKKKLCETVSGDRSWLHKIRPFWGHDYHFHVRIGCQPGSTACKRQEATPKSDGCDKSLAWWFTEEPWRPATGPQKPKARDVMTMASLPKECRAVLEAPAPVSEAAVTIGGMGTAVAVAPAAPAKQTIEVIIGNNPIAASAFAPTPASRIPLPFPRPAN
ncbi:penicillin-insensitive murein endopeptidase [Pseudaminobacter arsenicus]|uniref:Penicillin-insensitive murein endopeptidase n=1 Tax=Borborobacter arsenicus TaxID=1851146 RepID=A0A432V8K4_9HYPH|nr:penicillin-insensitive murein endopeptidase [Pseudaminobacter arsenicus]RUM98476.1 penicillin-insensitive murein endopeptidase [Pseudaminobacter arsenicus]